MMKPRFQRVKSAFSRAARKARGLLGRRSSGREEAPPRRDYGFPPNPGERESSAVISSASDDDSGSGDSGSGDGSGAPKFRPRKAIDEERRADAKVEQPAPAEKPAYKDYSIPPHMTAEQRAEWEMEEARKAREWRERERMRKANARKAAQERDERTRRQRAAAAARAKQACHDDEIVEAREPRGNESAGMELG